jgi:dTDP-4-amino-4,6-dideoxygalactose transaminase
LNRLDLWNKERRLLAQKYNERLKDINEITLPWAEAEATHVYHLYVIRAQRRDELKAFLFENGIETMVHYLVPPHLQKAYQKLGFGNKSYLLTEKLAQSVLSLPLWPGLQDEEIDFVADNIKKFYC